MEDILSLLFATPVARFVSVSVIGLVFEFIFKPAVSFNPDGSPKPWRIPFSASNPEDSTLMPFWLAPAILGLCAALFI